MVGGWSLVVFVVAAIHACANAVLMHQCHSFCFFIFPSLPPLNKGGHHLTAMLCIDLLNATLLYIHVWWETRKLVFAVDYTRFMASVSLSGTSNVSSIVSSGTSIPIDDVRNFIDLQYYLSWDQFAMMALGINLILFSIRLFSLMEIHPITKVFYQTFYVTVSLFDSHN